MNNSVSYQQIKLSNMKVYTSFREQVKDDFSNRIEKSQYQKQNANEQFLTFNSKLKDYFLTHNIMDLQIEILEQRFFALYDEEGKLEKLVQSPAIMIFDSEICNIKLLPQKEGIELYRFEIYSRGQGIGSILMYALSEVSLQTGIKIYLIPGEPGFDNSNTDPERRRNFYHKFGFKRCKDSEYWCN